MESKVVQIRGRGNVTLPAKMRARYALEEGDPLTIVDLDGVMVLVPKVAIVGKLAGEIERLARTTGVSMESLVGGVAEERASYYAERVGRRR